MLVASAGTEPRQLFNVVQFVIHDLGNTGKVTLEEAMKLTYLRFGRVRSAAGRPVCKAFLTTLPDGSATADANP